MTQSEVEREAREFFSLYYGGSPSDISGGMARLMEFARRIHAAGYEEDYDFSVTTRSAR